MIYAAGERCLKVKRGRKSPFGLTLVAQKDGQSILVRISDHHQLERLTEEAQMMSDMTWNGASISRMIVARKMKYPPQKLGEIEIHSLESMTQYFPMSCTEFEVIDRAPNRHALRPTQG